MTPDNDLDASDRHALVVAIWFAAGVVAAPLYHFGARVGAPAFMLAAFATLIAAFAGHVIVNVVYARAFSARELALVLALFAAGLVAFGVETLHSPTFAARAFLPTSLGFVALSAAFVFYLVAKSGLRKAFEGFDVIRSFRAGTRA